MYLSWIISRVCPSVSCISFVQLSSSHRHSSLTFERLQVNLSTKNEQQVDDINCLRPAITLAQYNDWLNRCASGEVPCLKQFKSNEHEGEWRAHGLRGLINMGNTCFMSCILQVLAHNPASQAYFLRDVGTMRPCHISNSEIDRCKFVRAETKGCNTANCSAPGTCLACELALLFAAIFETQGEARNMEHHHLADPLVPHRLLCAAWKLSNLIASHRQQDAHEFLMVLLDGLRTHRIQNPTSVPINFIHEAFEGSLRSDIVPSCCVLLAWVSRPLLQSMYRFARHAALEVRELKSSLI